MLAEGRAVGGEAWTRDAVATGGGRLLTLNLREPPTRLEDNEDRFAHSHAH